MLLRSGRDSNPSIIEPSELHKTPHKRHINRTNTSIYWNYDCLNKLIQIEIDSNLPYNCRTDLLS